MPRVLQVLSSLQTGGGVQVMLKNYYAQLAPLAFQTDFVVCGTERGGLEPWFEALGAEIHHIPPRSEDPVGNLRALRRILADGHYDVVHCHQDYHGAAAMAMARRCGVPVRIIHSHQAYPPESAEAAAAEDRKPPGHPRRHGAGCLRRIGRCVALWTGCRGLRTGGHPAQRH